MSDIVTIVNVILAVATIGLGAAGWLATRWTMGQLDIRSGPTNMAYTEVAAASGCLFCGLGAAALIFMQPWAFVMVGCAYGGAAIGRITSILRDNAGTTKAWTFFGFEVAFAALLIGLNVAAV